AEKHPVANTTGEGGGDQLLGGIEWRGPAAPHAGEVAQAPCEARDPGRERQQPDIPPGPERPALGLWTGRQDVGHVHQYRAHEQDREQGGPDDRAAGPAGHVSLREGSRVSMIMIFCQILRDSPVVSVSTSFTASSSTGS